MRDTLTGLQYGMPRARDSQRVEQDASPQDGRVARFGMAARSYYPKPSVTYSN